MPRSHILIASLSAFLLSTQGCGSSKSGSTGGSGGDTETGGSGGSGTGGSKGGTGGSTGGAGGSTGGAGGSAGGAGGSTGGAGGSTGGSGGGGAGGSPGDAGADTGAAGGAGGGSMTMSFFVTSKGNPKGGDFRLAPADTDGLAGADAFCKELATAASAELGMKTWRAYLSTSTVNARDRIGTGPWRNAKGVIIANNLTQLHDQGANGMLNMTWPIGAGAVAVVLDEKGAVVPSGGGMEQRHDILTGSTMTGMVDGTNTCSNWTSMTGMGANGHSNRDGGGRPPSWNAAHTVGCGPAPATGNFVGGTVTSGGGRGSIYCFATN
jgi:hypothetical protein